MATQQSSAGRLEPRPVKPRCTGRYGGPAYIVYPGVAARADRFYWGDDPMTSVIFEGSEYDLRRAGLLREDDRIPTRSAGQTVIGSGSRATRLRDGDVRLLLAREEAAARDAAFQRFMETAIAHG